MKPEKARELIVILIHLALWSELGVLTRIYLDRFFSGACSGSFGVCLTSDGLRHRSLGAYFPDLPSNMLGSFLMGLFAASGTLGIPNSKQLAILPESSNWQAAPELHIGLRTGFCGSLTTFASWEFSLVTGLIGGQGKQGGQWAEFLWGLIIGLQLSLSSYVFGQQCALMVDRYLVPGGRAEADLERELEQRALDIAAVREGGLSEAALALERDQSVDGRVSEGDRLGDDTWQQRHSQPEDGGLNHENGHAHSHSLNVERSSDRDKRSRLQSIPERLQASWVGEFLWQDSGKFPFHRKTNLAAMALTGLVTALFIVLTIVDTEARHLGRRQQWLAILFGPFGCTLRWLLSMTNYKLPGSWKWLPIGTFAANMLGCTIDYFVGGAISQVGSLSYWGNIVTYAIRTGFCGALSTVSTFVAEVQVQLKMVPEKLRGYMYSWGSLLMGALLGVIVYGPMYWTS